MPEIRGFVAATLFACIPLAACGADPFAPQSAQGVYELRTMNDESMPYDHAGLGCCTYLSGAFELGNRARYTMTITARNRNTRLVFTAAEWGAYEVRNSVLTTTADSFDVAPFLLDVGSISRDSIRVAFGGEGPGSADQFRALFVRGS